MEVKPIARIESVYKEKFGIPRQSNVVDTVSVIVFEPQYRVREAFVGIEGFEFLWLVWHFSESVSEDWSPTVRPPRLGGNKRVGVFATRSPFRPNGIGLSSVRLIDVDYSSHDGPRLIVGGADLMDGTPILDVKPYIPYTDAHAGARCGFAAEPATNLLRIEVPDSVKSAMDSTMWSVVNNMLAHDPRPAYQHNNDRIYGMNVGDYEIRFRVENDAVAHVVEINKTEHATKTRHKVS